MPSSCCNVVNCPNDRRMKDRWVVMPHVYELKFHRPKQSDIKIWQKKLERVDYHVSSTTQICSNHFKYGKPTYACRNPNLYMRSYPDWALNSTKCHKELQKVSDDIVCEVLSHMCQYLEQSHVHHIAEHHFPGNCTKPTTADELSHMAITMDKKSARNILATSSRMVPSGKCLESLAIYKFGAEIDCKRVVHVSASHSNTLGNEGVNNDVFLSDVLDMHNYSSPNKDQGLTFDHDYCKNDTVAPDDSLTSVITAQNTKAKKIKKCRSNICRKKISQLQSEVDILKRQVNNLRSKLKLRTQERNNKQQNLTKMENKVKDFETNRLRLSVSAIQHSDNLVALHTGLESYKLFQFIMKTVEPAAKNMTYWTGYADNNANGEPKPGPKRSIAMEDELLITLMKLKLNMSGDYLSFLFGASSSTISTIISTWIPLLSKELSGLIYWPSRQEVALCYPQCFKKWPGVTAILDCFEVPTAKPSHVDANSKIFSSYKNRPTTKFLIACTPGGSISFISPPAGGNMSDKELVEKCHIADKFQPGDKCMVDKGFRIAGELLEHGVELIIPPFVRQGKPFTDEENSHNKSVAHARIHVERVIGRVRDYAYMNGVLPINQLDLIGPAATVCCALTNLKNSVMFKRT